MNVISRPAIDAAIKRHPDAEGWLELWWQTAKVNQWKSLLEVRQFYPAADQVHRCLIFDARGNKYRLIVRVTYASDERGGTIFIKYFLTHAEYDRDDWKGVCDP